MLDDPALAGEDTRMERAHIAWQPGYLVLYTDPAKARPRFHEALELYGDVDNGWGTVSALLGLGRALRGLNALEDTRQALESSLALHQEIGNLHGESGALSTFGGLVIRQARFEEAEQLIQMIALAGIATGATALPPKVTQAARERGQARDLEAALMELLEGRAG